MINLKRLSATHRTELFLLTLAAIFDLSFGVEKFLMYAGVAVSNFWYGVYYMGLGLLVAAVAVFNFIKDVHQDCEEQDGRTDR